MVLSYYANRKLDRKRFAIVQISIGAPRFGAEPDLYAPQLAPPEDLLAAGLDSEDFAKRYFAHLETMGIDGIEDIFGQLQKADKREIALCCFESLKKPGQFCHRSMLAFWFAEKTGQTIPELT